MRKLTLDDIRCLAEKWGLVCISEQYLGPTNKLSWRCPQGHLFEAMPRRIRSGAYSCPMCKSKKRELEFVKSCAALAESRGGFFISQELVSPISACEWGCSKGHRWTTTPSHIKSGSWCPYCYGHLVWTKEPQAVARLKSYANLAQEKGGSFLSEDYLGAGATYLWECAHGHQWGATPGTIRHGCWCPFCSGRRIWDPDGTEKTARLKRCQEVAHKKGGLCISDEYRGDAVYLSWRCADGHEWSAPPTKILAGQWCPSCYGWPREKLCRKILSGLTGVPWVKVRPVWLGGMELDGYAQSLNLAFEYQGIQHFKEVPYFHRGANTLQKLQANDALKRQICLTQGVTLLEIPPSIPPEELISYIGAFLREQGIPLLPWEVTSPSDLSEMSSFALQKGGLLLSKGYLGNTSPLRWKCAVGHTWETSPKTIKKGSWCPTCARVARITLSDLQELAESRGGLCVAEILTNGREKILWQCREGHRWKASPMKIKLGQWCPCCKAIKLKTLRRKTVADMHVLATKRGISFLSEKYSGSGVYHLWACKDGHQWEATPDNITAGKNCPYCSGLKLWAPGLTESEARLKQAKAWALKKGGICTSMSYKNCSEKLQWQCACGHTWAAPTESIYFGSWCPKCARKKRHKSAVAPKEVLF